MRPLQVLPLPPLLLLLLVLSTGTGGAHLAQVTPNTRPGGSHLAQVTPNLAQPQVAPESPLQPKPPAPMGDGQHTWLRTRRHSPHFPLCSFCCNCCRNRGCGFCCRT